MDNTIADELNQENMNEFDLDIFMAIAKIRSDGKIPYSESIFKRILTLLDDEIITNKKRSGDDSLYYAEKTLRLLASKSLDNAPTSQDTPIIIRNTGGTKTDDGNLTDLTSQTSQKTPLFDSNGSKDGDRNLIVLTA